MVDLDRFKLVNDRYGHEAGDHALKAVAAELSALLRKSDLVCRYGGEELVLLLPDTPLDAAMSKVEGLCAHVRARPIVYREAELRVTLSAGVAASPDNAAAPAELLRAADGALYRAKESGRDRVCVAKDAGSHGQGRGL